MKALMKHKELWTLYKQILSKQKGKSKPETIRRVLLDVLTEHGSALQAKQQQQETKSPETQQEPSKQQERPPKHASPRGTSVFYGFNTNLLEEGSQRSVRTTVLPPLPPDPKALEQEERVQSMKLLRHHLDLYAQYQEQLETSDKSADEILMDFLNEHKDKLQTFEQEQQAKQGEAALRRREEVRRRKEARRASVFQGLSLNMSMHDEKKESIVAKMPLTAATPTPSRQTPSFSESRPATNEHVRGGGRSEMLQSSKGDGFSSHSIRSMRMAVDALAGEIDTKSEAMASKPRTDPESPPTSSRGPQPLPASARTVWINLDGDENNTEPKQKQSPSAYILSWAPKNVFHDLEVEAEASRRGTRSIVIEDEPTTPSSPNKDSNSSVSNHLSVPRRSSNSGGDSIRDQWRRISTLITQELVDSIVDLESEVSHVSEHTRPRPRVLSFEDTLLAAPKIPGSDGPLHNSCPNQFAPIFEEEDEDDLFLNQVSEIALRRRSGKFSKPIDSKLESIQDTEEDEECVDFQAPNNTIDPLEASRNDPMMEVTLHEEEKVSRNSIRDSSISFQDDSLEETMHNEDEMGGTMHNDEDDYKSKDPMEITMHNDEPENEPMMEISMHNEEEQDPKRDEKVASGKLENVATDNLI
jgi:hypothetical protein